MTIFFENSLKMSDYVLIPFMNFMNIDSIQLYAIFRLIYFHQLPENFGINSYNPDVYQGWAKLMLKLVKLVS